MTNRRRIYSVPRRRIVTPLGTTTLPPVVIAPPRFIHTSVRAIFTARPKVFSPPFSSVTIPAPFVHPVGRPPTLRVARGRINQPIASTLPPPGPAPLVPEFRRTRVISLRGLRTPRSHTVFPIKPVTPPPPLPGPPQSSGGIVKDFLHWWRTGADL